MLAYVPYRSPLLIEHVYHSMFPPCAFLCFILSLHGSLAYLQHA